MIKCVTKIWAIACILLLVCSSLFAQKCDTLRIDGAPNPYGCPIKALNIYKVIHKKVGEAIFENLNVANIKYCNNCPLQDWSYYNLNNEWSKNSFQFNNAEYDLVNAPTGVPCSEEREPAFFLANIKLESLNFFGNLPSIYFANNSKTLDNIYQLKADSITELYKRKGLSFADMTQPIYKEYSAATKLLMDESIFHKFQSSFTLFFQYNRTSLLDPVGSTGILKETTFKLDNKFTIPYTATDNLVDISNFQARDEEEKQFTDFSKKPGIDSKLGKSYESWVKLGQYIPSLKTDSLAEKADYSVYNFVVKIQGISFEKNHEILNLIDWNKLYSFINTKKL